MGGLVRQIGLGHQHLVAGLHVVHAPLELLGGGLVDQVLRDGLDLGVGQGLADGVLGLAPGGHGGAGAAVLYGGVDGLDVHGRQRPAGHAGLLVIALVVLDALVQPDLGDVGPGGAQALGVVAAAALGADELLDGPAVDVAGGVAFVPGVGRRSRHYQGSGGADHPGQVGSRKATRKGFGRLHGSLLAG